MTRTAYAHLLVLLRQAVTDNPPDDQVRRLSKGLVKALDRWLRLTEPTHVHARSGTPRPLGLASVNASVASQQETQDGEGTRTER